MEHARLGLIPLAGDAADARLAAFVAAVAREVDLKLDIHKAADYRALVAGLEQRLVDFAWLPPLSAARAVRSGSIAPLAVNVRNGATSYMTGLIAKKSGKIASLADLKGVRVGWVDRESASGYVVIRASLRALGVSLVDAFSEELFLRSHAEVARGIHEGRVDVGATCFNFAGDTAHLARTGYVGVGGVPLTDVTLLSYTGPIPADIFATRSGVAPRARERLEAAFFNDTCTVHATAKALAHADGFSRPTPRHMEMLDTLFQTIVATPRSVPPPGLQR